MGAQNRIDGKSLFRTNVGGQQKNVVVFRADDSVRLFEAHPLVESFNRENGTKLSVASHDTAHAVVTCEAFRGGGIFRSLSLFAADASIAYDMPGKALDKNIVFSRDGAPDVVLPTGRFKGEKDVALVALRLTCADIAYTLEGRTRTLGELLDSIGIESLLAIKLEAVSEIQLLLPDNRLISVPHFPDNGCYYLPHAETGVPHGQEVRWDQDGARELGRAYPSYAGLIVRGHYPDYCGRNEVLAFCGAQMVLGVLVEVPDADVGKVRELLNKP